MTAQLVWVITPFDMHLVRWLVRREARIML